MGQVAASDDELMARLQAGSGDAFEALYDRYRDRAYRIASSVCRDGPRAEEAVQGAFVSIWRGRDTYRARQGSVAAWLLTVVRHRAIDVARRHDTDAERPQPSLSRIPEAQREVHTLAFYGELSHTEIAAQLELPPGTVKGRMRLGLSKLRDELNRTEAA